jgi:Glucanosyltransferase
LGLPVNGSINRDAPTWSTNLLNSYIKTIDAFSKYDNVLVYNIGNEVVTTPQTTSTLAFVKAAARDTKAYLSVQFLTTQAVTLTPPWVFSEHQRSRLLSLATPPSMVMTHGWSHLQVISPVTPLVPIQALPPSTSLVSTISECLVCH